MPGFGRILVVAGVVLVVLGLLLSALGRGSSSLGHLPGDLSWRGRNWRVLAPLGTSLLLSVFLSLVMWVISRLR